MDMPMNTLGRTGLDISRCCLGTMTWGNQNTEAEGHAQMDYAVERGINFFDTAEMYAIPPSAETYGKTEQIVGSWFKARGNRDKIILATKICGRSNMLWSRPGKNYSLTRHTREQIDQAVEQSLRRLQTDYIDLYQMHWPDRVAPTFGGRIPHEKLYSDDFEPFEVILESMSRHVEKGNIRHVGVSNETPWGVMRFVAEAEKRGLPRIASIQNVYNLISRQFEEGLSEACVREDVSLLSYSPLAQGYLSGKYRDGALPEGSRKALFNRLQRYEKPGAEEAMNAYLDLAAGFGVDPAAFAIRFCDTRPFMGSTIIGATSLDQLKVCIDAFTLDWTADMEEAVDRLYAVHRSPCP